MLFNSIEFSIFLPVVFILYWFVFGRNITQQNVLLLVASYIFYGWWDWRFLSLIIFSTVVDYMIGIMLSREKALKKRKLLLITSLSVNLGFLGFFKYYNFFLESFLEAFSLFGNEIGISGLNIILPVGISFYTFQTLSYTIDIYRGKLDPSKNIIAFASFVSFFPQLVAGPIERATNLLSQFQVKRQFDYQRASDGLRQILWGLFKKVVIADNCAELVNSIFSAPSDYNGSALILGAVFFAFQIYGDFSGYSDIAIGTSRLFGFNLQRNFAFPYFSRDIAEFWRRWHISLSTWFRDYLYIPLGGSRGPKSLVIRNTFIIFIVSGFWHGANWTFVIWGLLHALYFLPLFLRDSNRKNMEVVAKGKLIPNVREVTQMFFTFCLTSVSWIFFRAENLSHAWNYLTSMFSSSPFSFPSLNSKQFFSSSVLIVVFLLIEWMGREDQFALERILLKLPQPVRWFVYIILISAIGALAGNQQAFIYFQF